MSDQKVQSRRNQKTGQVVSTKMAKTIVVEVTRRVSHPLYKRVVTRRKRFYAHDEESSARIGDTVRIIESRPLSRLKKWRLAEVLRRAAQVSIEPEGLEDLSSAPVGETGRQ
jgi:small subunit ribosomal protein S17